MFGRCPSEPLRQDEKAALENEAEEAMGAIGHMQAHSKLRAIVESSRGVSLVQTRDQQNAEQASSFIDHSTEEKEPPQLAEFIICVCGVTAGMSVMAAIVLSFV